MGKGCFDTYSYYFSTIREKLTSGLIVSTTFGLLLTACSSKTIKQRQSEVPYSEQHLIADSEPEKELCCSATGKNFAIASSGKFASKAGAEILAKGGNLVDAAVAVAFTIAVERPSAAGLGGGGFLSLHLKETEEKNYFLDFRETAPHRAHRDMYLDKAGRKIPGKSLDGAHSIATPGFVAGLYDAHEKWGKLPWKQVLRPAIRLAQRGFPVNDTLINAIKKRRKLLFSEPYTRQLLFRRGRPLRKAFRFKQTDLAKTLKIIASRGRDGFYKGATARAISNFVKAKGGILRKIDLDHYHTRFRKPIRGQFKEYEFISAPPPSAGGVMLTQMLGVLQEYDLLELSQNPADYFHKFAELANRGFQDRSTYIGDPDFTKIPVAKLTSESHLSSFQEAAERENHLSRSMATAEESKEESGNTAHFSLMDKAGNAISGTITLNYLFGSGLAVPGTGVFLNDEMDDFSIKPGVKNHYGLVGQENNSVQAIKRPASSMSPTIVLKNGNPVMAVGGTGGSQIITATAQVIVNYLERYGDLKKAIFAPRIHSQGVPDELKISFSAHDETVLDSLKQKGHRLKDHPATNKTYGCQYAVAWNEPKQSFVAVSDPSKIGGAIGK